MISNLPISACLIVKNVETYIIQCVQSLKAVVNQIIVVDTGSTDQTLKILKELDVEIYHYKWNDNFSDARNYSITFASEPTILVIDADEVLEQNTVPYLKQYLDYSKDSPGAVNIISKLDNQKTTNSRITRLFPNSNDYRYFGIVHEQLHFKGAPIGKVKATKVTLHHYGYDKNEVNIIKKIDRNLSLLLKQLRAEPESIYIRFQIGQTYYVGGYYQEAIESFDEVIKMVSNLNNAPSYLPTVFLSYGYCLLYTMQYQTLDYLLDDATGLFPDYTDLYFLYGISLTQRGQLARIEIIKEAFEYCLTLGEVSNPMYESVEGVGSYKAYYNLGVYFEAINKLEEAIECYNESAKLKYEPAKLRIKELKASKDG